MLKYSKEDCLKKLKKQITAVLILGLALLVSDCLASYLTEGISLEKRDNMLYMVRPEEGSDSESSKITAAVTTDEGQLKKTYTVRLDPRNSEKTGRNSGDTVPESEISHKEAVSGELNRIVSSFNDDVSADSVALPSRLSSGEKIYWKVEKSSNTAVIIAGIIFMLFLLVKNRYAPLQKMKKEQQNSIAIQLPEFCQRLTLLLNAGLVLNTAFQRSVEASLRYDEKDDDYFCSSMKNIYTTIRQTNGSFSREFREFARQSGSADLMRISNIISDNVSKGVDLVQELLNESEVLWLNRKKNCEERGRIAETKLTLPLTVFLMVLIVITVSPALLEL